MLLSIRACQKHARIFFMRYEDNESRQKTGVWKIDV